MSNFTEYKGEEVPACHKCGGAMLDDSRIGGLKCNECGDEKPYCIGMSVCGGPCEGCPANK